MYAMLTLQVITAYTMYTSEELNEKWKAIPIEEQIRLTRKHHITKHLNQIIEKKEQDNPKNEQKKNKSDDNN